MRATSFYILCANYNTQYSSWSPFIIHSNHCTNHHHRSFQQDIVDARTIEAGTLGTWAGRRLGWVPDFDRDFFLAMATHSSIYSHSGSKIMTAWNAQNMFWRAMDGLTCLNVCYLFAWDRKRVCVVCMFPRKVIVEISAWKSLWTSHHKESIVLNYSPGHVSKIQKLWFGHVRSYLGKN